ncbi:recombinase family protein [Polyangium sorediatum]|uniref:Recombinase family protein n=1 Tax=Polyangium sorediatum TaxID=889274 RepID=A0ABT6NPG8_9BACT|nr:recombinase family protein [Polyangium sorediatum]MDI1430215.1 recombinase family protein [Polyangium sorediatum]
MTIRAAIYARRSTDEHQVESLDTQLDNARRCALKRGYLLDAGHEFTDTASRAEFAPHRRPGFAALRDAALAGHFDVVVVRDDSRLGGDMLRVATFAQELTDAGVKILFYATGEEMVLDNEMTRLVAVMRGFASESERRRIASRTRESVERKARRGLVAGGAVYGYRNVSALDGSGRVREIEPEQAEVVREIFARYADGEGLRSVAKDLTERGITPPRVRKDGLGAWAPAAIHAMLRRPLYVGRIEWGHTHKTYKAGTKIRTKTHVHEVVVVDAPHLRIVPEELWEAVQKRIQSNERHSTDGGRPASYLLSGILRCGECGGPLTVVNGKKGYDPIKVYTCCRRRDRGGQVCASTLRRQVETVDTAVLAWVSREIMTEELLGRLLAALRERLTARAKSQGDEIAAWEREAARLRADVDKFAELALEAPAEARGVFFAKVGERQKELTALEARLRTAKTVPVAMDLEVRRLEAEARRRLEELRETLVRNPVEARRFIEELFPNGLTATPLPTPGERRMRLVGVSAPGRLFGIELGNSASPAGFEPA